MLVIIIALRKQAGRLLLYLGMMLCYKGPGPVKVLYPFYTLSLKSSSSSILKYTRCNIHYSDVDLMEKGQGMSFSW